MPHMDPVFPGEFLALGFGGALLLAAPAVKILSTPLFWGGKRVLASIYDANGNPREDLKLWQKNCRKVFGFSLLIFASLIEGTAIIGGALGIGCMALAATSIIAPYSGPLPALVGLTTVCALLAFGGYFLVKDIQHSLPQHARLA